MFFNAIPLLFPRRHPILPVQRLEKLRLLLKSVQMQIFNREKSTYKETFMFEELSITLASPVNKIPKPAFHELRSRRHFCDHMLKVEWNAHSGWAEPHICPIHSIHLHPASKILHYSQNVFEGTKAYRAVDGRLLLFRTDLNIDRMLKASSRAALPTFDGWQLLQCIKKLVSFNKDWLLDSSEVSLYIRPVMVGTENSLGARASNRALLFVIMGPVLESDFKSQDERMSLFAEHRFVRAWPGGIGDQKMGSNYAPALYVQQLAENCHFQQVLWLFGKENRLTEIGNMNVFTVLMDEHGQKELITPPLDGLILPGVTRQSVLEIAHKWKKIKVSERFITMEELVQAEKKNSLLEIFGTGTAHGICSFHSIFYRGVEINLPEMTYFNRDFVSQRLSHVLSDIQRGKIPSSWVIEVE